MTAIALLGGSFNPPHVAHQLVALYVLETHAIDELWFVPAFTHVFGKPLAPYDHRVAMCELAAAPLGARVKVSRAEQALAGRPGFVASRTLDLVEALAAERPEVQWRLVIGADILRETDKWHRWEEVARLAPPIVVGRPGHPSDGLELVDISATRIREVLAAGGDASALLPRSVLGYIAANGLYR